MHLAKIGIMAGIVSVITQDLRILYIVEFIIDYIKMEVHLSGIEQ